MPLNWLRKRRERLANHQIYLSHVYSDGSPATLVNRLGVKDAESLDKAEAHFVRLRIKSGLPQNIDISRYAGFKAIHRHILQDVYEWAGQERTYTTGRHRGRPFAIPSEIGPLMEGEFESFRRKNNLKGLSMEGFSSEAAKSVNAINAIHPFVDGNGRTLRLWLQKAAAEAGHAISFRGYHRMDWNEASKTAFLKGDDAPMARVIASAIERQRDEPSLSTGQQKPMRSPAQTLAILTSALKPLGEDGQDILSAIRREASHAPVGSADVSDGLKKRARQFPALAQIAELGETYVEQVHSLRREVPSLAAEVRSARTAPKPSPRDMPRNSKDLDL